LTVGIRAHASHADGDSSQARGLGRLDAFDPGEKFQQRDIIQQTKIGRSEFRALARLTASGRVKRNGMRRAAFHTKIRRALKGFVHVILFFLSVLRQGAIIYNAEAIIAMFF
jgi:hypothetical protein